MNFENRFTEKATNALKLAHESAIELGHSYVGSEHLLLGLLRERESVAAKALFNVGVTEEKVKKAIIDTSGQGIAGGGAPQGMTPRTKRIIEYATAEANRLQHSYIGTEHLLMGILREGENVASRLLASMNVDLRSLYKSIVAMTGSNQEEAASSEPEPGKKAQTKSTTKTLDQFSRDLTDYARRGKLDPVIGRDKEIDRVIQILSRRQKNNPALIGEPGVGKTAVAEGLARKIAAGQVPETLIGKRLVSLDLSGMIAGTKYRGEFEERIKTALEEIVKTGNIILFVDEMHMIIGAGAAEGAIDAANILKPMLSRGDLQMIGATTINEYRKHIEKDTALERRFQPITINEPSEEDAVLILKGLRDRYEAHHRIKITDEAITAAVSLSVRYISDRYLPDKAIDLIDEASSRARLKLMTAPSDLKVLEDNADRCAKEKEAAVRAQDFEKAARLRDDERKLREQLDSARKNWERDCIQTNRQIGAADVAEIISGWTGIPVVRLTEDESKRLLRMEDILHSRLVGQNEAVIAVSKAIRRGRVGLKDPKRPIGSFIFLGPTGVGKTELSKALAEALFGDEGAMIRVDMSEYMEKHTVSRLIGSPPGYVGYDEGGQLTEKIRRKPYAVILFDEIEKAHPDVFNVLLQILEDGHLTDAQGKKVNFKHSVIIMTSNIGARKLTETQSLGFVASDNQDEKKMKQDVLSELKRTFRPEFLNRIDDIIVFHQLNREEIKLIAKNMLKLVASRCRELGVTLTWDDSLEEYLAKTGFDPVYGARPLRRAIQSQVEDLIAEKFLDGSIAGNDMILLTEKDGVIVSEKITGTPQALPIA